MYVCYKFSAFTSPWEESCLSLLNPDLSKHIYINISFIFFIFSYPLSKTDTQSIFEYTKLCLI